ncbi:MAG: hypothetical protein MJZ36_07160 [Bacteroidaceae bacterium]|nr:hypothetical protein [Bacteroidaceae bacterium]
MNMDSEQKQRLRDAIASLQALVDDSPSTHSSRPSVSTAEEGRHERTTFPSRRRWW